MIVIIVDWADYKVRIKIVSDSLAKISGLLRGPLVKRAHWAFSENMTNIRYNIIAQIFYKSRVKSWYKDLIHRICYKNE